MDLYDLEVKAVEVLSAANGWVQTHPERAITWSLIGGIGAFVVLRQWYHNHRRHSFFKVMGKQMTAEDRRQHLDAKAADVLTEWQIDQWSRDKMSWQEVKAQCKRLGLGLPLRDLLPTKNHPLAIRQRVMKAIEAMKSTPKHAVTAATSVAEVTASNVVSLAAKAKGFKRLRGKSAA